MLDEIEDTQTFMIFCFVVRAVEACGSAASITASMTITANAFPDNMAQMMVSEPIHTSADCRNPLIKISRDYALEV